LKRRLFVEELITNGGNATHAAIAAGYAPHSAGVTGSRLLKDANVREAVREAEERALDSAKLSADRVLQELERAIFADPRKLYDARGRLKPIHLLDDDTASAIASIDVDKPSAGTSAKGNAAGATTKVRLHDKLIAIDRAMRYLGLFDRDNHQRAPNLALHVYLVPAPKVIDSDEK
jgi:phage terminase small subunit